MAFTVEQVEQLLHPINPSRVLKDGKGHSHVSQQDVTAHLIRVFGFGAFDTDVLAAECVFESERTDKPGRFDVCYKAMVRLTVRDPDGLEVCHFENGSTATAQNQTRGDAHDLAYKSAISLSVKRAAIALGDQFGLSLYNKGQMSALVMGTLVGRDKGKVVTAAPRDMQEGVPQQVSLGNDEIDHEPAPAPEAAAPAATRTMSRKPRTTKPPAEPAPVNPDAITGPQLTKLAILLGEAGMPDRESRLAYVVDTLDRPVESSKDLTKAEAHRVIERLEDEAQHPFPDEPPEEPT